MVLGMMMPALELLVSQLLTPVSAYGCEESWNRMEKVSLKLSCFSPNALTVVLNLLMLLLTDLPMFSENQ